MRDELIGNKPLSNVTQHEQKNPIQIQYDSKIDKNPLIKK